MKSDRNKTQENVLDNWQEAHTCQQKTKYFCKMPYSSQSGPMVSNMGFYSKLKLGSTSKIPKPSVTYNCRRTKIRTALFDNHTRSTKMGQN